MNDKISEMVIKTEDTIFNNDQHLKKICQCQLKKYENNRDAGYMTSSSDSLDTYMSDDQNWKLKVPPKPSDFSDANMFKFFKEANIEMENISDGKRRKWLIDRFTKHFDSVMPTSLIEMTAGFFFKGDSGIGVDVKPDWLDIQKFQRGQKFAMDNLSGIFYVNVISLFTIFSFEDALKPLILTNASSTPYTAFKRYLSTGIRFQAWLTSDPWTPGTPAYNDIRAVRRIHAIVRKKIAKMPKGEFEQKTKIKNAWCPTLNRVRRDFESTCPAPKPGQCPYSSIFEYPELSEHKLSQSEMASTQFAFTGLLVLNPKFFGMHDATDEDIEAYCHVWRGLGYLLGIEDEFNFCRGSLDDVRTRSRDFLEYWVKPNLREVTPEWEHMTRCLVEGLQYYFPLSTYEGCLIDLAEIMNLHLPRTYDALSYSLWIRHNFSRFYFNHASKLFGFKRFVNSQLLSAIEKARNYDESKHEELKEWSAKTIDLYIAQKKKNETSKKL